MRDPKRIPVILAKLEELWKKYPDLRFGQLVGNILRESEDYSNFFSYLFYIEDSDFEKRIDEIVQKGWI